MKCKALKKFWADLLLAGKRSLGSSSPQKRLDLIPLSAGLRIDHPIQLGSEKKVPASQVIWIFPASRDSGPSRSLKTLLLPN